MRVAAVIAVAFAAGCETGRPSAYVMCHNANCAYTDPSRDDTLPAFRESIALEYDGRAAIDGIELDLIWHRDHHRCAFEHDHADAGAAPDAAIVAVELAEHLRRRGTLAAWNGERFFVKLELKAGAAPDRGVMSAKMLAALADCALATSEIIELAAADAGLELVMLYESEDVDQLVVLPERPAWRPEISGRRRPRQVALGHDLVAPAAFRAQVGVVTLNWRDARDGAYSTYQTLARDGIDLMMWMFDASSKTLGAIEHLAPTYVDTNEAPLFRGWLD